MNILHHKSWHVRTKSNMERVRRDERKAAEEEQRVLDRQIQAENERRINQLRARADDRMDSMFGSSSTTAVRKDVSISDETGHVNLFQDLEREERKNHGSGNKEYEAEKAEEKKEWESKMGIQVYFAENTNDLNKKKEWYEEMPVRLKPESSAKKFDALPCLDRERRKRKREDEEEERKRHKKDKKKKKKKRHHRSSSSERRLEEEYDREKKQKMAQMRDERVKREREEKAKTYALLHPEAVEKTRKKEENDSKRKYNSQFNPEFFKKK